jgi:hypothetical protein
MVCELLIGGALLCTGAWVLYVTVRPEDDDSCPQTLRNDGARDDPEDREIRSQLRKLEFAARTTMLLHCRRFPCAQSECPIGCEGFIDNRQSGRAMASLIRKPKHMGG